MKYTITTKCHLTQQIKEYKMNATQKQIRALFKRSKDTLISFSKGWNNNVVFQDTIPRICLDTSVMTRKQRDSFLSS